MMKMDHPKVGVVIPDRLDDIQLNSVMQIPMELYDMKVNNVIFAPASDFPKSAKIPKVVIVKKIRRDSGMNIFQQVSFAIELNQKIRQEKIDVLILHTDPIASVLVKIINPRIRIAYEAGIEHASYDALPFPKPLLWLAFALKYPFTDLFFVESKYSYDMTVKFVPFIRKKLRMIMMSIPESFFLKKNEKRLDRKIILCVARVSRYKRQDLLVRSFARISAKHPDWKLVLIGPVKDEEYLKEIKKQILELGMSKKIEFLNFVSEARLRKAYLEASIFCLPSARENPAHVRLEAMAMRVPVVTTSTIGSDVVKGRGLVVPIDDEGALADALDRFISDKGARERAAKAGYMFARQIGPNNLTRKILHGLGYTSV